MGILSWIVLGLVVGVVAKFLMPGKDPGGFVVTTLLGVGGAVLGGWIATLFGMGDVTGFDFRSLLISVGGALLLLFTYRSFRIHSAH